MEQLTSRDSYQRRPLPGPIGKRNSPGVSAWALERRMAMTCEQTAKEEVTQTADESESADEVPRL